MFTLPGTPVLLYGDEIGAGEQLELPDRMAVRTLMQWEEGPRGGFGDGDPASFVRPFASPPFGPDQVSVAAQRREPESLLAWMERVIRQRRETPELGWGSSTLLETEPAALFAHRCDWQGSTVVAIHNLGEETVTETLDLGADVTGVVDLLEVRDHEVRDGRLDVTLGRYGYLWLRVKRG